MDRIGLGCGFAIALVWAVPASLRFGEPGTFASGDVVARMVDTAAAAGVAQSPAECASGRWRAVIELRSKWLGPAARDRPPCRAAFSRRPDERMRP